MQREESSLSFRKMALVVHKEGRIHPLYRLLDVQGVYNSLCVQFIQHQVAEQEAAATRRRIDDEEKKTASVYAYDPFHPTEYDNKHNGSKSQNVGFMKFGQ